MHGHCLCAPSLLRAGCWGKLLRPMFSNIFNLNVVQTFWLRTFAFFQQIGDAIHHGFHSDQVGVYGPILLTMTTPKLKLAVSQKTTLRSNLLAALLLIMAGVLSFRSSFVPPARDSALRGAPVVAAVAAMPMAASAADEYLNYNFTGEYTPFMIIGYFGLTTFLTAFAFGSYFILTKLKIIWGVWFFRRPAKPSGSCSNVRLQVN